MAKVLGEPASREEMRQHLAVELTKHGRSQTALAKYLGLDQSAVSRMVTGRRQIKADEWVRIKLWLNKTDPQSEIERRGQVDALPKEAFEVDLASPLSAYAGIYERLARRVLLEREKEEPHPERLEDYPLVLRQAAQLEMYLSGAVHSLRERKQIPLDVEPWPVWARLSDKIAALVDAGQIGHSLADRTYATLALRDAFAHSGVAVSLADPDLWPILSVILADPEMTHEEAAAYPPRVLRHLFGFATTGLAFHIGVTNREEALRIWDAVVMKQLERI